MEEQMCYFPNFPTQNTPRENDDSGMHFQSYEVPKKQKKSKTRRGGFMKKSEGESKKDYFTQLYQENRKKMLVNTFIRKLKQLRTPTEQPPNLENITFEEPNTNYKQIKIPKILQIVLNVLIIVEVLTFFIYSTLALTFEEVNKSETAYAIGICCLGVHCFEIVSKIFFMSSLKFKYENERSKTFWDLIIAYLKEDFLSDLIILIVFVVDITSYLQSVPYVRFFILIKLKQTFEKVKLLEIVFIENCYNEQYWELAKVFIFNFLFAHFVSILLVLMSQISPTNNWLVNKNLNHLSWFEKYIWAYYWAINTMLTVGFGDLAATTTAQAGCMIFIQVMSCITLTYNINTVGNIIRNIRSDDEEREKNMKIFTRMDEKEEITDDLKKKMVTFLNQSLNMRRKYNVEEEEKLLSSFPGSLYDDYKKQTCRKLFMNIPFFRHISHKYLSQLALKITRKLAHPEEIIIGYKKIPQIIIASGGQVSLNVNEVGYRIHGKKMQSIKLSKDEFKILSFNFLFNKEMNYDIKCVDYCIVSELKNKDLYSILKNNSYNYQYLCMTKDKDKFNLYNFQTFQCDICKNKERHTVFECPKLHFIPLRLHTINKFNNKTERKCSKLAESFSHKIRKLFKKPNVSPLEIFASWQREFSEDTFSDFEEQPTEVIENFMRKSSNLKKKDQLFPKKKISERASKTSQKSQVKVLKNLADELKEEIQKVEMLMRNENFFSWNLQVDLAHNFQYYFEESNPSNLEKKHESRKAFKRNIFSITRKL